LAFNSWTTFIYRSSIISDWSVYNYGLDVENPPPQKSESRGRDYSNGGNSNNSNGNGKEKTRWVTKCSICAKPISVPFEPDANRPVYCSECLENIKEGKVEALDSVTKNVIPASFTARPDKHADTMKAAGGSGRPNKQNVDTQKLKNILDTILGK
jgi:CxxC-x17-CxxC domain-containing protein